MRNHSAERLLAYGFLDDSTHPLSRFGQLVQHIVEIGSQLVGVSGCRGW